ncbi:hypothetical protein QIT38_gp37 [Methanocaldococcus fervens tailed virus 1]|uniref:YcfA family protein n=2 Tax=root TaxID=1 RepID=C7P5J9_METFA|nr:hypothetical protein [Methanocaldococcus fervens]YP_010772332.1 hypothetical protein QIT38_gp37 [Methanocaldococcus fervens tailed virus 1]ACV25377.1 hypothetical protein Mefer_1574 [Methanocaldococcus fervens AG86]QNO11506.1 hypothetical protein [Methanocaldococcus fervens tailed virus 1]
MVKSRRYRGNDIINSLTNKGFERKNSHHIKLILKIDGKKTPIRTKISHSDRTTEISDNIIKKIARQLSFVNSDNKIDWDSFGRFIECSMSYEEYVGYLKDRGVI